MQTKFLSNLAFLLFLNLLIKPFWIFGIDRAVQNEVGAEAYGSYFALFNFALILNIFLDLGINNFNNRNISQHEQLLGKYFPRIVALRLLLAIGYLIICVLLGFVMDYSEQQMLMLGLLCFNQFLLSFLLFLRSNIAGLQLFRIDSFISVLDRLLMIASCGSVLWLFDTTEPFKIEWFIYTQTLSYLITVLFALIVVIRKGGKFMMNWNPMLLVLILKKSLPFALLILLMSIYGRVDSVLLERLLENGKEETGIYAQAFRLLDASNMIAYLFAVLLLPMFSRMIKFGGEIKPLAGLAAKLLLIPAFTLAVICSTYGADIMNVMYQEHVTASGQVLSLLMFSLLPMAGSYIIGTLLTANGNLKELNIIALIGVISSFIFNLYLIPKYGSIGAAKTCFITQSISFTLQFIVAARLFDFRLFKPNTLFFILPAGLLLLISTLLLDVNWITAAGILVVAGGLLTLIAVIPDLTLIKRLNTQA
ncbi:oligosaccharide flippase family protein [Bacteroidota bacterium]